jgi:hypothetical protein
MNKAQNGRGWNDDGTAYTVDTHATQGVAQQAIGFEPRYYTRSGTGGAPTDTPTLIASNASKFGNAAPCVAHVVAPPLTATVERSTFWNGADVAESLTCTSNDQRMPDKGRMQMVVQPAVPYDLFQITAPINRQNRDERSPCHTLARDNAAHAAVVQTLPVHDPCPTLTSRMQGSSGWAPYNEDAHLVASVTQPLAFDTYNHTVSDVCQTIKSPNGGTNESIGTVVQPMEWQGGSQQDQVLSANAVCPALAHSSNTNGGNHQPKVWSGMSVRRLTPTECERLQGFPDGWTAIPWKGKPASECPDGPRYRALGNSMAVNVMRWIGRRIELVEQT